MSAVFADTFHFLALLNPRDRCHRRAQQISTERALDIVTTRAVLLELGDAFAEPPTRVVAAEFLEALEDDPRATIVPLDQQLYADGLALYRDRPDKSWSLTDCISFLVMTGRNITEALTGDHHFEQAGFTILLK